MPLVTTQEMFKKAYEGKYAVGAFNVNNMEIIQGIVEAAKELRSPLILQVSSGARKYANSIYLKKLVEAALLDAPELEIALHLDHGDTFELCKSVIDDGFTSVMIDGSHLPYEENVALTKQVVEYAHAHGVTVEGELGKLAGVEDDVNVKAEDATYTDPDQAYDFVKRTGVDSLAIAIGTSHGAYKFKGEPKLDIERLKRIQQLLPGFPIVLHGASSVIPEYVEMNNAYGGEIPGARGVPEELIREATKWGVCKVNIDSDIRLAMTGVIRKSFHDSPDNFDPRKYLGLARTAVKEMVKHKIEHVVGSAGKL